MVTPAQVPLRRASDRPCHQKSAKPLPSVLPSNFNRGHTPGPTSRVCDMLPGMNEADVLVVGGSLVGMTTAMLLAHHGVRTLGVEHHVGGAIHPRAALVTQRSMEILREVGLEQTIRKTSETQFSQDGAIMAVETLAGKELAWFISNINQGVRDVSPTVRLFITQKLLEPLMQQKAAELGAEIRFGTDMISFEQDASGVTAEIRNRETGQQEAVRARYMVACDGARSPVREKLGIALLGRGVFSQSVTIYFRAPVAPLLRERNLSVILVSNPSLRGFFRFEKPYERGFLVVNTTGDPACPNTNIWSDLTSQRCEEYVRIALGDSSIPVEVEDLMKWQESADTAERYQSGRVFLAGDSAHAITPYGGWNGNCGIQDAHNLCWKLAMILRGEAGEHLASTYETERLPVGILTAEQAYIRYVTREAKYLATPELPKIVDDLNVEMGYLYPDQGHENPRASKGKPGSRAPHVWLQEDFSILDLFGRDFTVLTSSVSPFWEEQAAQCRASLRIPLRVCCHPVADEYGIGPRGASLVRPDGFVSWRSEGGPNGLEKALRRALFL
jgi:2-polyprenyl-6-methoxyphenol hydroxylase-like FAD-dependent oxidoreductase